ncbi:MAG: hypothetical protein WD871_10910 [Xanthobacteraceae bacterium]
MLVQGIYATHIGARLRTRECASAVVTVAALRRRKVIRPGNGAAAAIRISAAAIRVRSFGNFLSIGLVRRRLWRARQRTAAFDAFGGTAVIAAALLRARAALDAEVASRTGVGGTVCDKVSERIFLADEPGEFGKRVLGAADAR